VAAWQTHNTHLVNFDVTTLRVIWFSSGALWGYLLGKHLMLRKHSRVTKAVSGNEWRSWCTHRLNGLRAAPVSLSHVARNGAAAIARHPSHFINNCIVTYEKNSRAAVLIQALPGLPSSRVLAADMGITRLFSSTETVWYNQERRSIITIAEPALHQ